MHRAYHLATDLLGYFLEPFPEWSTSVTASKPDFFENGNSVLRLHFPKNLSLCWFGDISASHVKIVVTQLIAKRRQLPEFVAPYVHDCKEATKLTRTEAPLRTVR